MNRFNFTERVRNVLLKAREEALKLGHEYIGTEHILLGLMQDDEGVASKVFQNLGIDLGGVRQTIDGIVKRGSSTRTGDLPYTSRAKRVLELSMSEARNLGHEYIGTEHVLLGLLAEEKGIAAQVLTHAGLSLQAARVEVRRLLGSPPVTPAETAGAIVGVTVEIRHAHGQVYREDFRTVGKAIDFLNHRPGT